MGLHNRSKFKDKYCFFVTTTCNNWLHIFTEKAHYQLLGNSLNFVANKYNADVLAYIFMPNHLHFILAFKTDNELSNLMRDFKKFTSGEIRRALQQHNATDLLNKLQFEYREQQFKVWMDGFDDVWLGKRELVETKIHYIHNNPLQLHWNLAKTITSYPYSSADFYYNQKQNPFVNVVHYREYF